MENNQMPFLHWKIKELREAAGLTQAEAAEKAGMNKSSFTDLEHGRFRNPTVETLEKVAAIFEIEACKLIGEEQQQKSTKVSRRRPKTNR